LANVDLVRSIYADWERGDFASAEWAHPEIEYVQADGPSPGSWTGVPAMASVFRDWLSAWEDWTAEAEEYRELDGERVLVVTTSSGRGKSSGLELPRTRGTKHAQLFEIHDGKATRLVTYWDRGRAFADLGLEEYAVSHEDVDVRNVTEASAARE
jgi:ketosteroid isomerase-like protein